MSCLISFVWALPSCGQQEVSGKFKMKIYASTGNWTSDHLLPKGYKPHRVQPHKAMLTSMEGRVYRLYLTGYNLIRTNTLQSKVTFTGYTCIWQNASIEVEVYRLYNNGGRTLKLFKTCEVWNWLEHGMSYSTMYQPDSIIKWQGAFSIVRHSVLPSFHPIKVCLLNSSYILTWIWMKLGTDVVPLEWNLAGMLHHKSRSACGEIIHVW